tara:strand:- start:374 stop:556 length:183 start_codon:yes stop_codon:yes gene_type:complete
LLLKLCIIELIIIKIVANKKQIFNLSSKKFLILFIELRIKHIIKKIADIENAEGNKNKLM